MSKVNPDELKTESVSVGFSGPEGTSPIPLDILDRLMAISGVEGVGLTKPATVCVYVRDPAVRTKLPKLIGGFAVHTKLTGVVSAQQAIKQQE